MNIKLFEVINNVCGECMVKNLEPIERYKDILALSIGSRSRKKQKQTKSQLRYVCKKL